MTEQIHEQMGILPDDSGRAAYAVPLSVLEAHRATAEQRAALEASLRDTEGYSLPSADAPLHLLSEEELEPFRLSDAQREAMVSQQGSAARDEDVRGFQYIGQFPSTVWVRAANTPGAQFIAAWFGGYFLPTTPAGARDSKTNRDANYYPPLH